MKSLIRMTMVLGLALCAATVMAQQPGGRGRGGQGGQGGRGGFGGGFQGGGRGGLALLADENVKKDLGITDDQTKKLEEFQTKFREEMGKAFQGAANLTQEERTAKFQELQKMTAAAEKEILLPKQVERLKQIGVQSRLGRGNTSDALTSEEISKDLGITDAQKEALKKAQEEADAEMQAGITKLREAARQKVLSVLTADQQAKLKSLSGETITFSRGGPGRGGPGGTGTGGRGGAGGRGAGGRPGAPLTRPPQGD